MSFRALSCLLICFFTAAAAPAADAPSPHRSLPGKAEAANAEHDPQPAPRQPVPAAAVGDLENALRQNADLLDLLYGEMRKYNPSGDGVTYWMSGDNALEVDWIQQTPNVWGLMAGSFPWTPRPQDREVAEAQAVSVRSARSSISSATDSSREASAAGHENGGLFSWLRSRPS
jgi:hypothetical protein